MWSGTQHSFTFSRCKAQTRSDADIINVDFLEVKKFNLEIFEHVYYMQQQQKQIKLFK